MALCVCTSVVVYIFVLLDGCWDCVQFAISHFHVKYANILR